jgi:hypothetical protein
MPIQLTGSLNLSGSLTTTGTITAQTLVVQTITSSVDFVTGSTRFGSISANTHVFTGSMSVSGSLTGTSATFSGSVTSDDLILTAGTLFGTGNTGFSNRLSDTTLYLQMPASGFNITDNALNTKFILSSAGAATFSSSVTINGASATTTLNVVGSGPNGILLDQDIASVNASSRLFFKMSTQTYTILADNNGLNFSSGATAGSSSGSPRMTISSSGNIGIGTTTPSGLLQVGVANSGIYFDVSTQYTPKIKAAGTISDIQIESVGSGGNVYLTAPGATSLITLSTAGSERMRITSGGTVTIQIPTSSDALLVNGKANEWTGRFVASSTSGQSFGLKVSAGTTSSDRTVLIKNQADNTEYFIIRGDGYMFSAPTYNNQWPGYSANMYIASDGSFGRITASSGRYKENINEWSGNGLDTILALKPKTFKYKKDYCNSPDNIDFLGLIAEEVAEVSPYLAQYENPDRTGLVENVRYDTIVVPLIKAIQELKAEFDTYKTTHP